MAEHYTQGRQGQGARRRRHNHHQGHPYRQRMPRPEDAPASKPSLLQRVLRFFGFGKAGKNAPKKQGSRRSAPPQKVRVAKANHQGGNLAAKGRRKAISTPPTRNARLYVGNLSYEATESELEDLFKGFGNVRSVEIIYNPRTYKSKGYAFVEMCELADAQKAAEVLHGQPFMGRELMVSAASEKPEGSSEATAPQAWPEPAPETRQEESPAPVEKEKEEQPAPAVPAADASADGEKDEVKDN